MHTLPPSPHGPVGVDTLPGRRHDLLLPDGSRIALVRLDGPTLGGPAVPLLLVHSVNAAASAAEMSPMALREAARRPVALLDLPGFGASDRPDVMHTPQRMQQAVVTAIDALHAGGASQVDLMALSLGCEFAAGAVLQRPGAVRTLALVSPTGMEARREAERLDGRTRETPWLRRLLRRSPLGGWLYRLLTQPWSVRWFLARSWGRDEADARLLAHALRCAAQPGARFAPLDFLTGALFTRGVIERYRQLPVPLWVAHGNRGSFTDFGACPQRTEPEGAPSQLVERTVFDTGAMPHCELPDSFDAAYQRFLQVRALREALSPRPGAGTAAQAARAARGAATLRAGVDAAPPRPGTTGASHGLAEDPGRPGGWPDRGDQPEPGGRGAGSTAPQGH